MFTLRVYSLFPCFVLLLLSFVCTSIATADTGPGLKLGIYFPGGMSVEGTETIDFDTSSALTVGVDYIFEITDSLLVRPEVDYSSFANGADDEVKLIDIGFDLLYEMELSDYTIRPYVGVAYGIGKFDVGSVNVPGSITRGWVTEESNEFLVTRLGFEVDFSKYYVDVGLREYSGGDEETVWINMGLLLRGGIRF